MASGSVSSSNGYRSCACTDTPQTEGTDAKGNALASAEFYE
jgi:hypothetical protein